MASGFPFHIVAQGQNHLAYFVALDFGPQDSMFSFSGPTLGLGTTFHAKRDISPGRLQSLHGERSVTLSKRKGQNRLSRRKRKFHIRPPHSGCRMTGTVDLFRGASQGINQFPLCQSSRQVNAERFSRGAVPKPGKPLRS